jgi:ribonuclease HI
MVPHLLTPTTIHDPRGNQIVNYALGFGNVSNNLVEAYSLWCGLIIAKDEGIKSLIVFGDSLLVIRVVKEQGNPRGRK